MLYSPGPGNKVDLANWTHGTGKEGLYEAFPARTGDIPVKLCPVDLGRRLAGETVPTDVAQKLVSLRLWVLFRHEARNLQAPAEQAKAWTRLAAAPTCTKQPIEPDGASKDPPKAPSGL